MALTGRDIRYNDDQRHVPVFAFADSARTLLPEARQRLPCVRSTRSAPGAVSGMASLLVHLAFGAGLVLFAQEVVRLGPEPAEIALQMVFVSPEAPTPAASAPVPEQPTPPASPVSPPPAPPPTPTAANAGEPQPPAPASSGAPQPAVAAPTLAVPVPSPPPMAAPARVPSLPHDRPKPRMHTIPRAPTPIQPAPRAAAESAPAPSVPLAAPVPALPLLPPRPLTGLAADRPPDYPEQARRRGEEGRVVVHVDVTADGRAADVAVAMSSGHPMLDAAALAGVRRWLFSPATRGGHPVSGIAEVPVNFHLE